MQLYTVKDDAARDLLGTLARAAEAGYEGVEFAGYHGHGRSTRHLVAEGSGIHDATLVDLYRRGGADIVGKPLHSPDKWAVHAYSRH